MVHNSMPANQARLVGIAGPLKGNVLCLGPENVGIGRDARNSVAVDDRSLSRQHCEIVCDGGRFRLKDLGSSNQTYVNGLPVVEHMLEHGDEIKAGRSVLLFQEGAAGSAGTDSPMQEESALVSQSTVLLRLEDARYLHPETIASGSDRVGRDLKCLLHAAGAIASIRGLDPLIARILELLAEAIPAEHGAILLGPGQDGEWQFQSHWRRHPADRKPVRAPATILQRVIGERVSIWSNDLACSGIPMTDSVVASGTSSVLAVPVAVFDRVLGAIYLDTSDPSVAFDAEHLQLLAGFAGLAAGPLESALQIERLEVENRRLHAEISIDHNMIGDSPRLRHVFEFVRKVARTESTVLIGGETGTGKEMVARAIHRNSDRGSRPFVAINCAALTESLLESELFGHEKGAFTGAVSQKQGKIEQAAGGTLFLDEVGELAQALQAKLLRVLQEREFERVGGTRTIKADLRLIAATNRDLADAVEHGAFRRDLYFRLNVVSIVLPPLRERREDITRLTEHFIARHAAKSARRVTGCSPETIECLMKYEWPGNIRELENAIERAVVLGSTVTIQPDDLPEEIVEGGGALPVHGAKFHEAIRALKRQLVLNALAEARDSYAEAARLLGLHPNNLHRLMRNLGILPTQRQERR
jgi:Nif-specific regulatory protein